YSNAPSPSLRGQGPELAQTLNHLAGISAQALSELEQERHALEERNRVLDGLMRWTTRSVAWRLLAPLRALQRFFFSSKYSEQDLLPWNDLESDTSAADEPATSWRATDRDPQFLLPCVLPAGWIRLQVELAGYVRGKAEIYADIGAGFPSESCLERISW